MTKKRANKKPQGPPPPKLVPTTAPAKQTMKKGLSTTEVSTKGDQRTTKGDQKGEGSTLPLEEEPPLCFQCDLLFRIVEQVMAQLKAQPLQANQNAHLLLHELRAYILDIGECCGRCPFGDSRGSRSGSDSRSSSQSPAEFWDNLKARVEGTTFAPQEKRPFKAPSPAAPRKAKTAEQPEKKE